MPQLTNRTFIALPADAGAWYTLRSTALPTEVRVQASQDPHITLGFLGDCAAEDADAAWQAVQAAPHFAVPPIFAAIDPIAATARGTRPDDPIPSEPLALALLVNTAWLCSWQQPLES